MNFQPEYLSNLIALFVCQATEYDFLIYYWSNIYLILKYEISY